MKRNYIKLCSLFFLLTLVVLSGCITKETPNNAVEPTETPQRQTISISEIDFFAETNITSLDVNVMGIALGDTKEKLIQTLGTSNKEVNENYTNEKIENLAYGINGSNRTAVVYHIENNKVTKILLYKPFAPKLKGSTSFDYVANDYYTLFGVPDISEQIVSLNFRKFVYTEKGLEIYLARSQHTTILALGYPL